MLVPVLARSLAHTLVRTPKLLLQGHTLPQGQVPFQSPDILADTAVDIVASHTGRFLIVINTTDTAAMETSRVALAYPAALRTHRWTTETYYFVGQSYFIGIIVHS